MDRWMDDDDGGYYLDRSFWSGPGLCLYTWTCCNSLSCQVLEKTLKMRSFIYSKLGHPDTTIATLHPSLMRSCQNRWIGRRGFIGYPPAFIRPHTTRLFSWGYLKDKVYAVKPTRVAKLTEAIDRECTQIPRELICDVCDCPLLVSQTLTWSEVVVSTTCACLPCYASLNLHSVNSASVFPSAMRRPAPLRPASSVCAVPAAPGSVGALGLRPGLSAVLLLHAGEELQRAVRSHQHGRVAQRVSL